MRRSPNHKPGRLVLAGVACFSSLALLACGASSPVEARSDPTRPDFHGDKKAAATLISQLFALNGIMKCTGQAVVVNDGNVRSSPDPALNDNIFKKYSGQTNVVIRDPETITFSTAYGIASQQWFTALLPDGERAFVNRVALVEPGDLTCTTFATAQTDPGTISIG